MRRSRFRAIRRGLTVCLAVLAAAIACNGLNSPEPFRLPVAWQFPLASLGAVPDGSNWRGMPLRVGDLVIIQAGSGIAALNSRSGDSAWTRRLSEYNDLGARDLLEHEGQLLVVLPRRVVALSMAGELLWTRDIAEANPVFDPAVSDGRLFVGTVDGRIVVISGRDGSPFWEKNIKGAHPYRFFPRGFAVRNDTVYVNGERYESQSGHLTTGVLLALSATDGHEFWRYETPTQRNAFYSAPVVLDSLIIVSDGYGSRLLAINRSDHGVRWEIRGAATSYGPDESAVVRNDTVFTGFADRYIYAADVHTGRLYWKTLTAASVQSVAVCNDKVLGNNQAVEVLELNGRRLRPMLAPDEYGNADWGIATSQIGVTDGLAIIVGTHYVTAIRC